MLDSLVILASSRKLGGICLAGKDLSCAQPRWIRPVCPTAGQAWPASVLRLRAGGIPHLGSQVCIPLAQPLPEAHQQENWLVGAGAWQHKGTMPTDAMLELVDAESALWMNGTHSVHGWNDRVPECLAAQSIRSSLRLIRPQWLRFEMDYNGYKFALRAAFGWAGDEYRLIVTDESAVARWHARLMDGESGHCNALLTISLGLPFHGYCYKLVAGVMELS